MRRKAGTCAVTTGTEKILYAFGLRPCTLLLKEKDERGKRITMLPLESNADDSFHNLFDSLRGQLRQRRELEQAELLLRVIEDARSESGGQHSHRRPRKEYMKLAMDSRGGGETFEEDDEDGESEAADGYEERMVAPAQPRARWASGPPEVPEGLRDAMRHMMNAGDLTRGGRDILSRAGSAAEARRMGKKRPARGEWGGKVHTLDDLPRDTDWFLDPLGARGDAAEEESTMPEIKVSPARRLSDGRRFYSAEVLGGSLADALRIGPFTISLEWLLVAVIGLFLAGVWLGRIASRTKARRELATLRREHAANLLTIRNRIVDFERGTAMLQQHQQQQQQQQFTPQQHTTSETGGSHERIIFPFRTSD